jgi:hypothetical protein
LYQQMRDDEAHITAPAARLGADGNDGTVKISPATLGGRKPSPTFCFSWRRGKKGRDEAWRGRRLGARR